jgi:hypothetical protein
MLIGGTTHYFRHVRALRKSACATQIVRFGNNPGAQADGFVVDQIESLFVSSRGPSVFLARREVAFGRCGVAQDGVPRVFLVAEYGVARRARDASKCLTATRLADSAGTVCFAGTNYAAGRRWARQPIDVTIVAGSVQLSRDGKVIRVHPIRHDCSRELGAFANPKGRPRRKNSATGNVA